MPRLTANGILLRVNYQIDGNNNTQKDRAGLRQMPMSEVMIREVKIITTGYAPEFGQTAGLIYNAMTPSGTNTTKGQGSYRFQRESFAASPFFAAASRRSRPPTSISSPPISVDRSSAIACSSSAGSRIRTAICRADASLPSAPPTPRRSACRPAGLHSGRARYEVRDRQGRRRLERDEPPDGALHLLRQLHRQQHRVETAGVNARAGHRFQRPPAFDRRAARDDARRRQAERAPRSVRDAQPGTRPGRVRRHRHRDPRPQVANFGAPIATTPMPGSPSRRTSSRSSTTSPSAESIRTSSASTCSTCPTRGHKRRFSSTRSRLLRPTTRRGPAPRRSGTRPFSSSSAIPTSSTRPTSTRSSCRTTGGCRRTSSCCTAFVTTCTTCRRRLPIAPYESSRDFVVDKNNWQPRVGVVWTLDEQPPHGAARQHRADVRPAAAGDVRARAASRWQRGEDDRRSRRRTPGAPAFPNVLVSRRRVRSRDTLSTVVPDFTSRRTWQSNVQVERP